MASSVATSVSSGFPVASRLLLNAVIVIVLLAGKIMLFLCED